MLIRFLYSKTLMAVSRILPLIVVVGVLLLCRSLPVSAQESITLTTAEYPPLNSESLKHKGLVPRIISEAFRLEGVDVVFEFNPWARAYRRSKLGQVHGTAQFYYSDERAKDHYYSDPVMDEKVVWFHLKSFPFNWKKLEDIANIKVGVLRGYTYTDPFLKAIKRNQFTIERADEPRQLFEMMLRGRIDIFPENIDIGYYKIFRTFPDYTSVLFTNHHQPFLSAPSHLLFSRKHPESPLLLEKFNRGLRKLKESGLYDLYLEESRRGEYLLDK